MDRTNIIPDLCLGIREKQDVLCKNPNYDLFIANQHRKRIFQLANLYSWWLEHPGIYNSASATKNPLQLEREIRRISRAGKSVMNKAWNGLCEYSPLLQNINPRVVIDTASQIDHCNLVYRNARVSLCMPSYTPPNHLKVSELMDGLFWELKSIDDPIEASFYFHLRLAGIQPFIDGNKRVARIIQNRILYENQLPPPTIMPADRDEYITLLENALVGFNDHDLKPVREFYGFLGSRVQRHLDEALYTL
ncbi:Fic family protein [Candidatus Woesearchaeota archaeon]|nr:Fic family protein [Candidatus Woesearchaeota archaeon]